MEKIKITERDKTYVSIEADESTLFDIRELYSFEIPNARFHPLVKKKRWDGVIRVFKPSDKMLPYGLVPDLIEQMDGIDFEIEQTILEKNEISFGQIEELTRKYNLPDRFQLRDYQLEYTKTAIDEKRSILISPTGSGKSLVIYMYIRYILDRYPDKKILLLVPTIQLVEQMYSDFVEYGCDETILKRVHSEAINYSHQDNPSVVISTWQSMKRKEPEYFEQFFGFMIDEVHIALNKSEGLKVVQKIGNSCVNAEYRLGTTGSLDDINDNIISLKGMFGQIFQYKKTKELMEDGYLAELEVHVMILEYEKEVVKALYKFAKEKKELLKDKKKSTDTVKYNVESEFIINSSKRNKFIAQLALSRQGNTLVTFRYVRSENKPHGQLLYEYISKMNTDPNRKIFFIHGNVDVVDREMVREIVEKEDNAIIIATEAVFAMGINIKKLDHLIPANGGKSNVIVMQSLGRILRKYKENLKVHVYDVSDALEYSGRHLLERLRIYKREGYSYKVHRFKIGE